MEQLDQEFTQQLQDWLGQPAAERDLQAGAAMFLRLRPSARHLYKMFLIRPEANAERLEYELTKHLRIRLEGFTMRQVAVMNKTVVPQVAAELTAQYHGRREDHDRLPAEIKNLYDRNGVVYEKMKSLYNSLLAMDNAPACDRFEMLNPLRKLDDEYRNNWAKYDGYQPESETPDTPAEKPASPQNGKASTRDEVASPNDGKASTQDEAAADEPAAEDESETDNDPTPKEVSAARKFISTNLHKIENEEMDEKKKNELVDAIYQRVRVIDDSGGSFKPDMADRLRAIGIDM